MNGRGCVNGRWFFSAPWQTPFFWFLHSFTHCNACSLCQLVRFINMFSFAWTEAVPCHQADALTVAKKRLETVFPI